MGADDGRSKKPSSTVRSSSVGLGLRYGLLAGLGFTLAAWGVDCLALSRAAVDLFWLKLAIGGGLCLLLGALAGSLTALVDQSAIGALLWVAAGVSFAWISGHLPFEGTSEAVGLLAPRFRGLDLYPFVQYAGSRTVLIAILCGGGAAVGGVLQLVLQDMARGAGPVVGKWFALALGMPVFLLLGFIADSTINLPLRQPLVAMDRLIRFAKEAQHTPVDPVTARQRRLSTVKQFESLLDEPRRVLLGDYGDATTASATVEVDFDGTWVRCNVISEQPVYCQFTEQIYAEGLACLLEAEGSDVSECKVWGALEAEAWLDEWRLRDGSLEGVSVVDIYGSVALIEVTVEDGQVFRCRFRGAQPPVLEVCEPL